MKDVYYFPPKLVRMTFWEAVRGYGGLLLMAAFIGYLLYGCAQLDDAVRECTSHGGTYDYDSAECDEIPQGYYR